MHGRGHKIVILHTESPYEDDDQLERAHLAHINLLNDPANIDAFRQVCPDTHYMPHAYRPGIHTPGPVTPELACDFTFNGTGYESRMRFFEAMDLDGLDVMLTGNWAELPDESPISKYLAHEKDRCLDNEQVVDCYRSARAGINLYRREAQDNHVGKGWAVGPREIEQAACGLFFLRDPRPEGDDLLWMLPTFEGPRDASDKLRWWLRPAQDQTRADVAVKARQAVADRTFTNNARRLLAMLDRQPAVIS